MISCRSSTDWYVNGGQLNSTRTANIWLAMLVGGGLAEWTKIMLGHSSNWYFSTRCRTSSLITNYVIIWCHSVPTSPTSFSCPTLSHSSSPHPTLFHLAPSHYYRILLCPISRQRPRITSSERVSLHQTSPDLIRAHPTSSAVGQSMRQS